MEQQGANVQLSATELPIRMIRPVAITNATGKAMVQRFSIKNGPEGIYEYFYFVRLANEEGDILEDSYSILNDNDKIIRSQKLIYNYFSPVFQLQVLTQRPRYAEYGMPFTIQPKMKLLSLEGNPIKNKKVTCISWPEPSLHYFKS